MKTSVFINDVQIHIEGSADEIVTVLTSVLGVKTPETNVEIWPNAEDSHWNDIHIRSNNELVLIREMNKFHIINRLRQMCAEYTAKYLVEDHEFCGLVYWLSKKEDDEPETTGNCFADSVREAIKANIEFANHKHKMER